VPADTISTLYRGVRVQAGPDHSLYFFHGTSPVGGTQLPIRGTITALSATDDLCYGVTDAGEIVRTADGMNWSVFDFNAHYAGYYPACRFTCVCVTTDGQVAVAGVTTDSGTPVMYLSMQNNVWSERPLTYTDANGFLATLAEQPLSLHYNPDRTTFLLRCTHRKLMVLPPCSHCNELRDEEP
jgi:hypothetical protein